ncbi:MAG: tyrosine-type recombinase/integrase [Treponema sp.]|jgi:site-specific recombinase XerD|nr:tyrosine-type recombinase/integrase [Treponema sp.]
MQKGKRIRLPELMAEYETALTKCGFGYATRLRLLQRAAMIISIHERRGKEFFDGEIIVEYIRDINDRFYNGEITKKHSKVLHRETERLLWFAESGEIKMPNPQQGARQTLTSEFERIAEGYLSLDMHPNTRNDARWITYKYFSWLSDQGHEDLKRVGSLDIQRFMLDCSKKMSMNSIHDVRLHLAKLYVYLYESGQSESSYQALFSFRIKRESKIRSVITRDEIAKALENINRSSIAGKRAYAVMMLGVVLGLRACDVANLKLDDIDWINGEIKILQQKTAVTVILPLTKDVGEALTDYILNARPNVETNHIFIKLTAPFEQIKSAVTIGEIFRDCCKAAGLDYGKQYHMLRRSLATSMVTNGVSIYNIAQELGDENIDSVKPYIALDSIHLKLCALPFYGIAPIGGAFCG